jgi:hypothetical protein
MVWTYRDHPNPPRLRVARSARRIPPILPRRANPVGARDTPAASRMPVRGFLPVRKKLGLALVSEKADGGRCYRIAAKKPSRAKPKRGDGDRQPTQHGAAIT